MALVNLESALRKALAILKKTDAGAGLEILTYKRNRGVSILKTSGEAYKIIERGYLEQEIEVPARQLSRLLKSIMKREFPRSRKVRIYCLKDPEQAGIERKRL